MDRLFGNSDKSRWLILLTVGVIIVLLTVPTRTKTVQKGADETDMQIAKKSGEETLAAKGAVTEPEAAYEEALEDRLEDILGRIEGVGKIRVMVIVSSSAEKVLQMDEKYAENEICEEDSAGGTRKNRQIDRNLSTVKTGSDSAPYVIREELPRIEGILVACEGGNRASLQAEISDAIQALFGLEAHKIKVCKMTAE